MIIIANSVKKTKSNNRPTYKKSDQLVLQEKKLSSWENNKPDEYESKYTQEIDALLDNILNRKDFSYNPEKDPMYNQYRSLYTENGKKAMRDTVGQVSALTGGYGNSYAVSSGSQAYHEYLNQLNSLSLDIRDRAYEHYKDEGDKLIEDIGLLRDLDGDDYDKYLNQMEAYYKDGDYLLKRLSQMSDSEYEKFLASVDAWESDREYSFKQYQDKLDRAEFEKELAFKKSEAKRDQANADRAYRLSVSKAASSKKEKDEEKDDKKGGAARVPTSYGEFCLRTGFSGIMTNAEFKRSVASEKKYGTYKEYLKAMYERYS